jgi:hemerythrin
MEIVSWTPDLSVGQQKIDEQHQELFKRFNQVGEAIWNGQGKEEIGNIIEFLADYVNFHFADEEALMLENDYPEYSNQKSAHEGFILQVSEIKNKFEAGEATSEFVVDVITKLGDWFKNHIKKLDKDLGDYLASRISGA